MPSHMPSAVASKDSISTVGESAQAKPFLMLTFLTFSQFERSQLLRTSARLPVHLPPGSTTARFLAAIASSALASLSFHAFHPASSILTRASVLASGLGASAAAVLA